MSFLKILKKMYTDFLKKKESFLKYFKELFQKDGQIEKVINRNHKKSSWVNIAMLITNMLGFLAYCIISPVLAEYYGQSVIQIFSKIAIVIIFAITLWEGICLLGYQNLKKIKKFFSFLGKKVFDFCGKYFTLFAVIIKCLLNIFITITSISFFIVYLLYLSNKWVKSKKKFIDNYSWLIGYIFFILILIFCTKSDITYCTSVVEVYGIPTKTGEELTKKERENCAAYWKVKDYSILNYMELTYVERYKQLDLMKQNSTAYGMSFFQPVARIEIYYKKDKSKYLSLKQDSYIKARNNKFREPKKITYYNNSNKIILTLEKNKYGKFDITYYSSTDIPQLLNSTLLYTQNEDVIENNMTSQQIEVTYNAEGLPETRRLSPYIYNSNGINGEYYVYDKNQRLTTLCYLDINGEFVQNKQGIMMIDFQYEDNGNLRSIRYYSDEDRKMKTEGFQGVFCERFSYDSYGNLKERSQRDRNENLRSDMNGVCIYRYNYDTKGTLLKEEFLGVDGEPVQDNRFHSTCIEFEMLDDNKEREISISMDAIGSSSLNSLETVNMYDAIYSSGLLELDDSLERHSPQHTIDFGDGYKQRAKYTNISERETIEFNQKPFVSQYEELPEQQKGSIEENTSICLDKSAEIIRNYVSIHYKIDHDGFISEQSYHDSEGELVECEDGYAKKHFDYKQKKLIYERYFSKNDKPYHINGEYAIVKNTYESDQDGKIKTIEYLNSNEELVFNTELGYARIEYTRILDDNNRTIYKKYFDENKNLIRLPELGYAMVQECYNGRNFLVREVYYNEEEEETCRTDYGVAEIWYEYEDSGNRICELYKDEERKLVNRFDTGYAAVYWKYEGGQIIDCHYEGSQNQMLRNVVDKTTGISGIKYTYKEGKKFREEYYDTKEQPSFRKDIGCAAQQFEYNDTGKLCKESYYGVDGKTILRKDKGYATVIYQDNEYGQHSSVRFYDTNDELVIGIDDHCAGYDYSYDSQGNVEWVKYIGLDEELMVRRDIGYAQVEYKYDTHGNILEEKYYDKDLKLAIWKGKGYARSENRYDNNGNLIESRYYNAENEPILHQEEGYFKIENDYYNDGRLKFQKFYDTDGEQLIISTKYHCAGVQYKYDDNFDNDYGFSYERNEKGVKKITTYIGLDEKPMSRWDLGYAKVETVYDIWDNEVSAIFYDCKGNVTVRKEGGYAAFRNKFENGNWVKGQYYGINNELVQRSDTGYACIKNKYDEFGQKVRISYYNKNNKPIISTKYHCASFIFRYDERGNKTHIEYVNTKDRMMIREDLGYAQIKIRYDSIGNKISEAYLDTEGRPAISKEEGYASYISEYENGREMEIRYYDKSGKLTQVKDEAYAIIKNAYDDYGQWITQTYYDASEVSKPVVSTKYHCAGFQFKYDELGNKTYIGYLDLQGNLVSRIDLGYSQIIREFDCNGNIIKEHYFDINGESTIDMKGGYSYYKATYNQRGELEKIEYFKKDAECIADIAYDDVENIWDGNDDIDIFETLDEQGELVLREDTGYAIVKYRFDDSGKYIGEAYYDTKGKPIFRKDLKYAGCEYKYDEKGNEIYRQYFGTNEESIIPSDLGYAQRYQKFDKYNNLIKVSFFNEEGYPAIWKEGGCASYEKIFKNGNWIATYYYDTEGKFALRKDYGYAIIKNQYNEFGQCVSQLYYGSDALPINSIKYNCAGFEYEYDEDGYWTSWCIGLDGERLE